VGGSRGRDIRWTIVYFSAEDAATEPRQLPLPLLTFT